MLQVNDFKYILDLVKSVPTLQTIIITKLYIIRNIIYSR